MENTVYVALSRQMILRRQMDVVANNIANAETTSFKLEKIIINTASETLPDPMDPEDTLDYVLDVALGRDFGQGALARTGGPLDFGIEGEGFFKVAHPDGERFTRDGRFSIDEQGRLTTRQKLPVQGDGGDIILDPKKGEPTVASDGTISQAGLRVGKLSVFSFESLAGLSKTGDGLYRNDSNIPATAATNAIIQQATLEGSNVQPILEITNMIEINRAYEQITRMMDQTAELDRRSIERLGRLA